MTDVICDQKKCAYLRNGMCTQSSIELFGGECEDFVYDTYTDGKDYQTEYFKVTRDGKHRYISRGKRVILGGEEFFTEDDDRNGDDFVHLTHARTGAYAGSIEWVRSHWEETLERAAKLPDMTTLPFEEGVKDADE
ncbi:MAG: hypothetical protein K2N38_07950 [Oscillospiraceae bacterium]|nr:hypothetical protein [Oscillospiraceae bacterium]